MGAVYVGTHIKLRKRVAIKVLNPELSSPPMVERFHREAITASQIGHEGSPRSPTSDEPAGRAVLVMEYLDGESLASRLRASGPCGRGRVRARLRDPVATLRRAWRGHRSPRSQARQRLPRPPEPREMVKLLDFGISRAAGLETEFRLTTTGLVSARRSTCPRSRRA